MSGVERPAVWTPVDVPAQAPAVETMVDVGGAKLWCWDTGGDGPAVVLLHAGTGSGAFWGYQQPVLAQAGYRAIGYSRRGHFRSESGDRAAPGIASDDLLAVADHFGLSRFHLLGLAAGGIVATDFAISHGERLTSLTLASTIMGVTDRSYVDLCAIFRPPFFTKLPKDFQELGPSYRAGNPRGAAQWLSLEEQAIEGERLVQNNANIITWAAVAGIRAPTLLLTGTADLYTPPSILRLQAQHLAHAETVVIDEAGHAPNWEQPDAFNAILLAFLGKHR
jgi:pimeloyl-ACP methyl ester carboxylesterase